MLDETVGEALKDYRATCRLSNVTEAVGRILAFDVGDRRIGLALSDPLGWLLRPITLALAVTF